MVGDSDAGYVWRVRAVNGALLATGTSNTLDAATAAADAALGAMQPPAPAPRHQSRRSQSHQR